MRSLPPVMTDMTSTVPTLIALTAEDTARDQQAPLAKRYPTLSKAPLAQPASMAMAKELDALYQQEMAEVGSHDARYIQRVYAAVVYSELTGRGLLALSGRCTKRRYKLGIWLTGTSLLSLSKILNNMELGHNVMHGQYDWMQHPYLNSQHFDWDIVCPSPLWQHSHNFLHHTFTNIVERDHDVGYHLIRVTDEQAWLPADRHNMLKTVILALGFEWAVAFHDIQISVDEYADAPEHQSIMRQKSRALFAKIARQVSKDYIALPAIAGVTLGRSSAMTTLSGNITANVIRNLWTWAVIFCGHLTDQAHIYTHLDESETRGEWYVRQILGSSNLQGSRFFHILTGNLSHQIEHHIFPDMPANRYAKVAPKVEAICQKYGVDYNTGRFAKQFRQVIRRIHHFSKPTTAEWDAYQSHIDKQAQPDSKSTNHKSAAKPPQRAPMTGEGIGKPIPQVLRQAWGYAWSPK